MNPERDAMKRALVITGVSLGFLALVSGVLAWVVMGSEAAMAAVAGVGVAACVGMSTQVVVLAGARLSSMMLAGIVFGTFLIKVTVLIVIMWAVDGSESFPRGAFLLPLVIGAVLTLVIDVIVVWQARVPYVTTRHAGEAG